MGVRRSKRRRKRRLASTYVKQSRLAFFAKGTAWLKGKKLAAMARKVKRAAKKLARKAFLENKSITSPLYALPGGPGIKAGVTGVIARVGILAGRGPARGVGVVKRVKAVSRMGSPNRSIVLKAAGAAGVGSSIIAAGALQEVTASPLVKGSARLMRKISGVGAHQTFDETGFRSPGRSNEEMPHALATKRRVGAVPQGRAAVRLVGTGSLVPRVSRQQVLLDYGRFLSRDEFFTAYGYMPAARRRSSGRRSYKRSYRRRR